jgi:hypothetical protein
VFAGAHFGQPGYETDLLYLAGLAALVLGGSGPFALDQLLRRRASALPGLRTVSPFSAHESAGRSRENVEGPGKVPALGGRRLKV